MSEQAMVVRQGSDIEKKAATADRLPVLHETASSAAAAKAQALVQARYLVARANPRDWLDVRDKMLAACKRTRFAEVARYRIPRGGKPVTGFTIRFAEEAMRNMRNLSPETNVVFEDDEKRILAVALTDLEANINYGTEVVVTKTIERKSLKEGELPLRTRLNSRGETLYILPASDDDLGGKQAAMVSKALRTLALRLLPGDILDECLDAIEATRESEDAKDPKSAVKKIADAFSELGVKPSDLKAYLRHDLDSSSPKEVSHLRELYQAIKEGHTNWREVMEELGGGEKPADAPGQETSLKDKVKAKAAAAAGEPKKDGGAK